MAAIDICRQNSHKEQLMRYHRIAPRYLPGGAARRRKLLASAWYQRVAITGGG